MSRNFLRTVLNSKAENLPTLTPASSLSSITSSKSSDSSTSSSRSSSSVNLSLFTTVTSNSGNKSILSTDKQTQTSLLVSNNAMVNPVIHHQNVHHNLNSNNRTTNGHHNIHPLIPNSINSNQDDINQVRFMAHNCLVKYMCFGQMSGEVFASVGNDNQIKLWSLNNANSLLSLKSRTYIESLQFSRNDEFLATGSMKGAIQIWDLNNKKVIRSFRGHQSLISCLDFFPSDDYITSSSSDGTVKLWDVRKKGFVHSYDEHEKSVVCQKISPDGKWIASGDVSGIIKIWDLTAGKKIAEFREHTSSISDIKFNPFELVLASSSQDGSICVWDLDNFELICKTCEQGINNENLDVTPINKILFHPNQHQLFATARNKYFLYELGNQIEIIKNEHLNYGVVKDLAYNKQGLVMISNEPYETHVIISLIKWQQIIYNKQKLLPRRNSSRKSFDKSQLNETQSYLELLSPSYVDDADFSPTELMEDYPFLPTKEIPRSLSPVVKPTFIFNKLPKEQMNKKPSNITIKNQQNDTVKLPALSIQQNTLGSNGVSLINLNANNLTNINLSNNINLNNITGARPNNINLKQHANRVRNLPKSVSLRNLDMICPSFKNNQSKNEFKKNNHLIDNLHAEFNNLNCNVNNLNTYSLDQMIDDSQINFQLEQRSLSIQNLENINDNRDQSKNLTEAIDLKEEEILTELSSNHSQIKSLLKNREENLKVAIQTWKVDISKSFIFANSTNDIIIVANLMLITLFNEKYWDIQMCQTVLPYINILLQSKLDVCVDISIKSIEFIFNNYLSLIKQNISTYPGIGVDLSREERRKKSVDCYTQLISIRGFVLKQQCLTGELGSKFRKLSVLMERIDAI